MGEGVSVLGADDSETASVRERQPLLKTLFLPCSVVLPWVCVREIMVTFIFSFTHRSDLQFSLFIDSFG